MRLTVGGTPIRLVYEPDVRSVLDTANVRAGRRVGASLAFDGRTGRPFPVLNTFWFAAAALVPGVRLIQ
jgi:hypothetical protein